MKSFLTLLQTHTLKKWRGGAAGAGSVALMSAALYNRYYSSLSQDEVTERVLKVVKSYEKLTDNADKVTGKSSFDSLGLDSLDHVELMINLEEEFNVELPDADSDKIKSTKDAIEYFMEHPDAK